LSVILLVGIALIIMGLFLLFLPSTKKTCYPAAGPGRQEQEEERLPQPSAKTRGGGVIMIGPIPIIWGSDPKTALFLMIIALAIMVTWILSTK
jgi:uncharacterized protein (TIGR00304 family)